MAKEGIVITTNQFSPTNIATNIPPLFWHGQEYCHEPHTKITETFPESRINGERILKCESTNIDSFDGL